MRIIAKACRRRDRGKRTALGWRPLASPAPERDRLNPRPQSRRRSQRKGRIIEHVGLGGLLGKSPPGTARLWSHPAATAVAGVLSDSPRAPPMDHSGRWWRGWTHAFALLGAPDRDLADLVIDAFLNGLTGATGAGPLVLWPFIPEHGAFAAALDRVFARRGSPNARFGGQKRCPCARRGARRRSDTGPISPAAQGARSPAAPPGRPGSARPRTEVASSFSAFQTLGRADGSGEQAPRLLPIRRLAGLSAPPSRPWRPPPCGCTT